MAQKRLYGPAALGAAAADTYVVPAGRVSLVRQIHVENGTGAAINFTCSVGADAAGTRLADAKPVPANDFIDLYLYLGLAAAEKIQALGNLLVITIMGDENVTY